MTNQCPCYLPENKPSSSGGRCKLCKRVVVAIHRCHAKDCEAPVPPKMLFCLPHWRMVLKYLQRQVWKEYTPGQEIRKNPTVAYLNVMKEAIRVVAKIEQNGI